MKDDQIKIGITIGDVNGIGIEVILKTLSDNAVFKNSIPIIYGSAKSISFYKKQLGLNDFNFMTIKSADEAKTKKVNLINCWPEEIKIVPGEKNANGGKYAVKSLDAANADLQQGKIDAIVTAPINKDCMKEVGFEFPGHTEYFAKQSKSDEVLMLMVSENLRVGVVTGHIPLKNVPGLITEERVESHLKLMLKSLRQDFLIMKPRIAVLGLNPHAGDRGAIGDEEMEIILPLIEKLRSQGELVFGCYSADGFFGSSNLKNFDGVLAMYHDQGLIGFKSISFNSGVNFSAGLPIVRTSPDHGTAYDLAGKGAASEKSFRNAYFQAIDVFRNRKQYAEINKNPLQKEDVSKD